MTTRLLRLPDPAALLLALLLGGATAAAAPAVHWVAVWGASPARQIPGAGRMAAAKLVFRGETLREIVPASLGGDTARVRLSNVFGPEPVEIGAAHLAVCAGGKAIMPGTDRVLTFGGRGSVTLPPGAVLLSDPVDLRVPAGGELTISLYVPGPAAAAGIHYDAQQTCYVGAGDQAGAADLRLERKLFCWTFLGGVDVLAPPAAEAVVAFGDSITDGAHSTRNANERWPDLLAARLRAAGGPERSVVDAGIGGNRLLHDGYHLVQFGVNGLARFGRDVLEQPGVRDVIVLEGINDIGHPGSNAPESQTVTAADLIGALRQLIGRAHERGLRIIGATLTPFAGTTYRGYYTPAKEEVREAVNRWIRTSGAFDGVVDFDRAVRDPADPLRLLPRYDSGDHLHPDDAGYRAMAAAIDLSLLR
jgi:lysophospholipase L1-like esterase